MKFKTQFVHVPFSTISSCRIRPPLWYSGVKETKCFFRATRRPKDSAFFGEDPLRPAFGFHWSADDARDHGWVWSLQVVFGKIIVETCPGVSEWKLVDADNRPEKFVNSEQGRIQDVKKGGNPNNLDFFKAFGSATNC